MNNTKEVLKKLAGNRGFVSLMALAVVVVTVMAVKNKPAEKTVTQIVPPLETEVVTPEKEIEPTKEIVTETVKIEDPEPEPQKAKVVYKLPLQGDVQRGYFTEELMWDETMQDWRTHQAVDIGSEEGDEVDTAAPGVVTEAKSDSMCGFVVEVDHGDGVTTVYKNLAKIVVKEGDALDEGQMIGTVGGTAPFEMAQKPHLHFEAIKDDEHINPLDLVDE